MGKRKTIGTTRRQGNKTSKFFALSPEEFAQMGSGKVSYVRTLTSEEAQKMYPTVEGLPGGICIYALHDADGTPLALTDSHQAALGHAMGDDLEVRSLH